MTLDQTTELYSCLADASRVRLLSLLLHNGETCVCDLVEATGLTQTNVSRHLGMLRRSGIISGRKQGQWVYYSVTKPESKLVKQVIETVKEALAELEPLRKDLESLKQSCCETAPMQITLPSTRKK